MNLSKIRANNNSRAHQASREKISGWLIASLMGGMTLFTSLSAVAQTNNSSFSPLEQELIQGVTDCLSQSISNPEKTSAQELETASVRCFYQVVILAGDGTIRQDAQERLKVLVKLTGISFPTATRKGEATIQLQQLPNSNIFTIPVTINGKTQQFVFDTGASTSIITSQLAQALGLQSVAVPNELLKYMVVGDDCGEIKATMHTLPLIAIDSATAAGLMGIGLSKILISDSASGVLGMDVLSGFDVIFNPESLQLKLLSPSPFIPGGIPLDGKLGLMTAKVRINGQGPFTFLLDTGAEKIVVSQKLADKLGLQPTESIEVKGFCGTETASKTNLQQVTLQEYGIANTEAVIVDTEVLKLLGIDGIIGQSFLNNYQQHWQFGATNELGFSETGNLRLFPLKPNSVSGVRN